MSQPRWASAAALATLLGLIALAALAPRPAVDNAPASWFPRDAPGRQTYAEWVARYGGDEVLLVELGGGDGSGLLRLSQDLEQALASEEQVASVLGPSTAYPSAIATLADPELSQGAERFVGWQFQGPLNRTLALYGSDPPRARLAAVLRPATVAARQELEQKVEAFRARATGEGRSLRVAGQPLVNLELDRAGQAVEQEAMPLLVGVCVVLLLLLTRSVRRGLALLAPVGLVVFASEGLLGLSGVTSNLIVTVVKPLLFVLLLATGAHLLVEFAALRRAGWSAPRAAWGAAAHKAWACLLALATTALGFGSLGVSQIGPIRTFGWLSAAGLVIGAPALLILLPALLARVEGWGEAAAEPAEGEPTPPEPGPLGRFTARVMLACAARPLPCLALGLLGLLGGGYGAAHLSSQPHAIRYLPPEQRVRADYEALEEAGAPLAHVELVVRGAAPITSELELLRAVDAWAEAQGQRPGARGVVGPTLLLREAGYRAARVDDFPASFQIREVLAKQPDVFADFIQDGGRELRFSLAVATLGPAELRALVAEIEAAFRAELAGRGLELSVTGSYPLLLATQEELLATLRSSLLLTALLMQLVLVGALRSWRLGLAALLPNAFPVAGVLGTMWAFGIPLDVGTSMAAAIALGIAVDDTLHVLCAWQVARGPSRLGATARSAGAAILLSSLVVAAGFLAITSAPFAPTRNFGVLCAVAMLTALVGDLVLLPACLRLVGLPDGDEPAPTAEGAPAAA